VLFVARRATREALDFSARLGDQRPFSGAGGCFRAAPDQQRLKILSQRRRETGPSAHFLNNNDFEALQIDPSFGLHVCTDATTKKRP